MRDEQIGPHAVDSRQGRRHAGKLGLGVAPLQDGLMRPMIKPFRAFNNLRRDPWIDSHVPLCEAQREMRERADGEPRGDRTRAGGTDAVSDDGRIGVLIKAARKVDARKARQEHLLVLRRAGEPDSDRRFPGEPGRGAIVRRIRPEPAPPGA